jgi:cellulose synthase/poly-beta-1,6-N-acetylglucosamine synthase-like glycosyltransferase
MEVLTVIYLFFVLTSLYLSLFFLILHNKNKGQLLEERVPSYFPGVSIIIPAYNEEKDIGGTISTILESDYPKDKLEIIVVNDGSTDNTLEEIRKFKGIRIINKENSGKADSINKGIGIAKFDLVGVVDADSYPNKDAIRRMIAYFEEDNVAAVTSSILVKNRKRWFERLQAYEYTVIGWTRKLLQFVEGIYVTPGPLSIYKRDLVLKYGGFDTKNLTEDIEMTWRILSHGHKVRISLNSKAYTVVPQRLRDWWKQRVRWNLGGLQTMLKYKHIFFNPHYGMMGFFVVPFFTCTVFLGIIGLGVFSYVVLRKFFKSYLMTKYSYDSQSSFLRVDQMNLNPNVFALFALVLVIFGISYLIFSQKYLEDHKISYKEIPIIAKYLLVYLALYPVVLLHSMYRWFTKKIEW